VIVYCATTNPGKLREFRAAAQGVVSVEPLPGLNAIEAPEETGNTFEENAVQKALYYGAFTAGWLFAEDSGLEVDALRGAPGVYSARFSGPRATDESNNVLLLQRLAGVQDRAARYVCAIALVHAGSLVTKFRGTVEGSILESPQGTGGFGYDPLFFYPPFGATFAEVDIGRKQSVSHRGGAVKKLMTWLAQSCSD
jgi:XTP/dITP diphosphohydrolase